MQQENIDLSRTRHVVLDMDGTLYSGGRLFECTLPFLERLRRLGIGYTFLTNNTSLSRADYLRKLAKLGIDAAPDQMYTAADSTIAYLREHLPGVTRVAVLGTPSLAAQFAEEGFTDDWDAPEAVVVAFDTTLVYERLCRAAYFIQSGLPFLATHPDLVCPTDQPTVLVDCGAICACLTAATGKQPVELGKPEPSLILSVCRAVGVRPAEAMMVGDRVYTDIAMGRRAGVPAVLVLTGEATEADAAACPLPPDLIVPDVGVLGERLEQARHPL
jgi:NagD protein